MIQWLVKKLFKNFGIVTKDIYRSGQPGFIRRWIMYKLYPYRSVINVAYSQTDKQDADETRFCLKRKINYVAISWGAGGPLTMDLLKATSEFIDDMPKPIWIHCEGGKDRTGGLVAYWKKHNGYNWENIINDFRIHKVPANGWLVALFEEHI